MTRSRIYTKTGDDGTTGLLYGGRVSKGDELVDAYGDIGCPAWARSERTPDTAAQ